MINPGKTKRHSISMAILILICVILYANTLENGFVYDDILQIKENPNIRTWGSMVRHLSLYRAVRWVTYAVDYHLWGLNPAGYHVTNILLHAVCTLCVYFFVIVFCGKQRTALLAGLLFALHPIHTEAVDNIANRPELLATFFFLLSFILFLLFLRKRRSVWLPILSFAGFILSLLSKETVAAPLPFILIAYLYFFEKINFLSWFKKHKKICVPLGILFFAPCVYYLSRMKDSIFDRLQSSYSLIAHVSFGEGQRIQEIGDVSVLEAFLQMLFIGSRTVVQSLWLLLAPFRLLADYSWPTYASIFDTSLFLSLVMVIGCVLIIRILYRYSKQISFCLLWMLVALVPVSNFIPLTPHFVAERYLYMPSIGFCLCVAILIDGLFSMRLRTVSKKTRKHLLYSVCCLLLIMYGYLTYTRNAVWRSEFTLWYDTAKKNPKSHRAFNNLGLEYKRRGSYDEAINAFEQAIRINAELPYSHNNLGILYGQKERYDEAIVHFQKAIELDSLFVKARNNLGIAYMMKGAYEDAIGEYKRIFAIYPNNAEARQNLGSVYQSMGLYSEAIGEFQKAIEVEPELSEAYFNLGNVYEKAALYGDASPEAQSQSPSEQRERIIQAIASYKRFLELQKGEPRLRKMAEEAIQRLNQELNVD